MGMRGVAVVGARWESPRDSMEDEIIIILAVGKRVEESRMKLYRLTPDRRQ